MLHHLNDLSNPNQSAYKKNHSTETTLLKITNDITTNVEKKRVTFLDLSAAFDIIDHAAILKLLSSWFGISVIELDWIQSYLYDRGQTVKTGENLSDSYIIKFGVLQGSVLGPTISSIIRKYVLVNHQLYADDTEVYFEISLQDATAMMEKFKLCLNVIKAWITLSNSENIFCLFFLPPILDHDTSQASSVRNIRVTFDSEARFLTCLKRI